jgi:DNA anti-recombination protein RmuC
MSEKDLGQELENIEEGIENLKNKEFKLFGIKLTPMTVSALVAGIASIIGSLYGGFLMYQKVEQAIAFVEQQEEYEAKIADFEEKMALMQAEVNQTIEYARDIKGGLRDDIIGIEKQVDRVEDKLREQEADNREIIQNAEERFENKRDALQNDYDEKANRLSESSSSRMTDLENKMERDMKDLEDRINKRLQRALDNPLAN